MSASPSLLREPDFLRLWIAGLIGYFVRWLEILVFGIVAYERTESAFLVATTLMLRLLPLGLFGVPLGALAARVTRRHALTVMTGTLATSSLALLVVASTGRLEFWHLAVASFVNGIVWAADNPMRRGPIGEIAGAARMGRAMALDVGASNASRLAGPGIDGLLLANFGIGSVLVLLLALNLMAFATVLRIAPGTAPGHKPTEGLRATLSAGFDAARASPRLRAALWITTLFNLFGWPVLSMVPVIGRDQLGLAPDGVGLLASMDGVGTLLGAIALAALARPSLYGRLYIGGMASFLALLPIFALSTHPLAAGAALLALGIAQSAFSVMQATIVFVSAPADRRVHAMGLLTMCIGIGPIGLLMLGWLAEHIGAPAASAVSALTGLLALLATWPLWRACWRDRGVGAP